MASSPPARAALEAGLRHPPVAAAGAGVRNTAGPPTSAEQQDLNRLRCLRMRKQQMERELSRSQDQQKRRGSNCDAAQRASVVTAVATWEKGRAAAAGTTTSGTTVGMPESPPLKWLLRALRKQLAVLTIRGQQSRCLPSSFRT